MEEHKSVTVQVDKAAGKIYVDGVLPNATLCLYHIRGKVVEVKQAREESASFDLPCSGEYVLVITHALSVPVVKQLVIEYEKSCLAFSGKTAFFICGYFSLVFEYQSFTIGIYYDWFTAVYFLSEQLFRQVIQ